MKNILKSLAALFCAGLLITSCSDDNFSDTREALQSVIREAEMLIAQTQEGIKKGDIAPGSKATLQTRIDQAYHIMDNTSWEDGYTNASKLLKDAIAAFKANIVKEGIPHFGLGSKMNLGASADWALESMFTIEMKVRFSEFASGDQCIIANESGAGGFMIRNNGNQIQFYIYDSKINNWNGGGCCTIEKDTWYHITASYKENDKMKFYLDGVEKSSVNCGKLAVSSSDLQLGTSPFYNNRYMRGDIQHVSIWSEVRTADQVIADAACNFSGTEPGLKAYWPLDLNIGTELTDKTGNHIAKLIDVTWRDVN